MTEKEKMVNAIAAHAKWRFNLKQAIENDGSDITVAGIRSDRDCAFGKWLFSLPIQQRTTEQWRTIRALHVESHAVAAEVLDKALSGRCDEAEADIAFGGSYTKVSSKLSLALTAWRNGNGGKSP